MPASPAAEQAAQQQQRFRKRGKSPATPAEKEELVENAGLTPKTKKTTASPTPAKPPSDAVSSEKAGSSPGSTAAPNGDDSSTEGRNWGYWYGEDGRSWNGHWCAGDWNHGDAGSWPWSGGGWGNSWNDWGSKDWSWHNGWCQGSAKQNYWGQESTYRHQSPKWRSALTRPGTSDLIDYGTPHRTKKARSSTVGKEGSSRALPSSPSEDSLDSSEEIRKLDRKRKQHARYMRFYRSLKGGTVATACVSS